jgi:cytoskeletal protein RodZ
MKRKKEKNGEPKKSTGRYGGQSDSEQDKQTLKEKRKKKKKSWFRNSRISVLIVLVLLL